MKGESEKQLKLNALDKKKNRTEIEHGIKFSRHPLVLIVLESRQWFINPKDATKPPQQSQRFQNLILSPWLMNCRESLFKIIINVNGVLWTLNYEIYNNLYWVILKKLHVKNKKKF